MPLKVLVAPLDWGLGHATRCIPVIKKVLAKNHEVILAGNASAEKIFKAEFPQLKFYDLKGYEIKYHSKLPLWFSILLQLPKIFSRMRYERKWLMYFYEKEKPDVIISDNRFGFHHDQTKSIYITHQLNIELPKRFSFLKQFVSKWHQNIVSNFDECWIPDFPNEEINLSGKLSHPSSSKNVFYCGPLSRFDKLHEIEKDFDIAVVLSGPEPLRSEFENKILAFLNEKKWKVAFVRGVTENASTLNVAENITVFEFLHSNDLHNILSKSKTVLSRSGYSSVMDWHTLNLKALLIPTPGQSEQEYLAQHLHQRFNFLCDDENLLNPDRYIEQLIHQPIEKNNEKDLLSSIIDRL